MAAVHMSHPPFFSSSHAAIPRVQRLLKIKRDLNTFSNRPHSGLNSWPRDALSQFASQLGLSSHLQQISLTCSTLQGRRNTLTASGTCSNPSALCFHVQNARVVSSFLPYVFSLRYPAELHRLSPRGRGFPSGRCVRACRMRSTSRPLARAMISCRSSGTFSRHASADAGSKPSPSAAIPARRLCSTRLPTALKLPRWPSEIPGENTPEQVEQISNRKLCAT
ncbi:predicted protein [Micromonas commoda]|uniref:Uncharacterized protein n=1 Tax=Micromonas commoda (strain RCC299 / NOUM17 / CCMP2709) TaxID=296587 RepID=C1EG52_MICCC|nr:predicted protein [Micromonas commoda]ACO66963.1 predicted protein [Micromonas commoda]|eukprot:XP_002505705.1 predicted protein [Micromonas commoda]